MLSKRNRLTKRGSFAYVYKNGKKGSDALLKLFFVRSSGIRIGFSVSNKIGKANVRNKIKRRLRGAVRQLLPQIKSGCQMVFSAKPDIVNADYSAIFNAILRLLEKNELLKKTDPNHSNCSEAVCEKSE